MLKRPSEHRLSFEERIAVVVAVAVSIGVHLAIFLGGSGISHLAREEKKRERLMVIRRVREITPAPDLAVKVPDPRRVQVSIEPSSIGATPPAPQKSEQKVSKRGTQPPPKAEITPRMEEDLQESLQKEKEEKQEKEQPAEQKGGEIGDNSVSVVTDLPSAVFTLSGPAEFHGSGTFWIRRGAQAGTYRVTFSPVAGFNTPPPQTKDLPEKGQIVFVGKYRRGTEVVVDANETGAQFTIYRPDGRPIDINRPGRATFDDLPPGNYTAVFKDLPGHVTPSPVSHALVPGGKLVFVGEYKDATAGSVSADAGAQGQGAADGAWEGGRRGYGGGSGREGGSGSSRLSGKNASVSKDASLDRRVQMVVTSYPPSRSDEDHDPIPYPEMVIHKSDFQQGWCQVYLVLEINGSGEVEKVLVQRPRSEDRSRYEALIKTVEDSVRSWDYDKVRAEVHVDVRFYVE